MGEEHRSYPAGRRPVRGLRNRKSTEGLSAAPHAPRVAGVDVRNSHHRPRWRSVFEDHDLSLAWLTLTLEDSAGAPVKPRCGRRVVSTGAQARHRPRSGSAGVVPDESLAVVLTRAKEPPRTRSRHTRQPSQRRETDLIACCLTPDRLAGVTTRSDFAIHPRGGTPKEQKRIAGQSHRREYFWSCLLTSGTSSRAAAKKIWRRAEDASPQIQRRFLIAWRPCCTCCDRSRFAGPTFKQHFCDRSEKCMSSIELCVH